MRVLVLDDEPYMHRVLVHMLSELGIDEVATLQSAHGALGYLATVETPPDLILLDLNMPAMDGIEFLRKVVEQGYTGAIVLVSAESERVLQMTEKLVQAHNLPVLGHLRKPVSRSALAAILRDWRPQQGQASDRPSFGVDELREAMRRGHLVTHFQPKVAVAGATVVGVEALVRWDHPEHGLVPPEQFVAVAEEHGLVKQLTRIVLGAAFAQAAVWRRANQPLGVAINVSMASLVDPDFADYVLLAAQQAGALPQMITLEITESRLMLDERTALEILARLRLKRFRLSIDDFGTGHSSLAQLRDIAFDELKIDRGFVHGAGRDPTVRAMYDASLGLGRQLGIVVVAEGVEDHDDWDLVRASGCDLAQGWFIGAPMPEAEFAAWMAVWNRRAEAWRLSPA
jgi:EAL domain-containing protein (putative c-di-GMP-specific phosphodiesterase class I)/DNA-binding NarL/FixJ family response regulator